MILDDVDVVLVVVARPTRAATTVGAAVEIRGAMIGA